MTVLAEPSKLERILLLLQALPAAPRKLTTAQIVSLLADRDIRVTQRSVQRDLQELRGVLPIECNARGKPYGWGWSRDARLELPVASPHVALVFCLAGEFLQRVLPPASRRHVQPHVERATELLKSHHRSGVALWLDRVRVLERGQPLIPPTVDPGVLEAVCQGVLERRQLRLEYRKRGESESVEMVVNSLGLIFRAGTVYLVCTKVPGGELRTLVLHRAVAATTTDILATVPDGFDLDREIANGIVGLPSGDGRVFFRGIFRGQAAPTLVESRLGDDHAVEQLPDGAVLVSATVVDTLDFRAWLRSYGPLVEVLEPESIRSEMIKLAAETTAIYAASQGQDGRRARPRVASTQAPPKRLGGDTLPKATKVSGE